MATGLSIHIGLNELDEKHYNGRFTLFGCVGDAHAMRDLAAAAGFETHLLTGDGATSTAVLAAIAGARRRVGSDGMLLVTYSGHGGRVRDLRDERENDRGDFTDGWDETWCLYDRELIDDELYACWTEFPKGARVLVVCDSCFSGGMLRADKRGAPRPPRKTLWGVSMVKEAMDAIESLHAELPADGGAAAREALRRVPRGSLPRKRALGNAASKRIYHRHIQQYDGIQKTLQAQSPRGVEAELMLLSAAQDNEAAADGDTNGAFTKALLEIWNGGAFEGNYVRLYRELYSRLAPGQHPLLLRLRDPSFVGQRPFSI